MGMRDQLNAHLQLLQEKEELTRLLGHLRSKAAPGERRLDGMPRSCGPSDKVGDLATEIVAVQASLDEIQEKIQESEARIKPFIDAIPDARTRLVFTFRFIHGNLWKEVADHIGGNLTLSCIAGLCYEYLKKQEHRKEGEP